MPLRAIITGTTDPNWIGAVERAVATWSTVIEGDADIRIELRFTGDLAGLLAHCSLNKAVFCGFYQGTKLSIPGSIARLQGWSSPEPDCKITINPDFEWSFAASPPGNKFWAEGVMMHELGHNFYCMSSVGGGFGEQPPFFFWKKGKPASMFNGAAHFQDVIPGPQKPLMTTTIPPGEKQFITDFDKSVMAECGVPVKNLASRIYLIPGGRAVGGSGQDTAVWLGTFSDYNCVLTGIERLEMPAEAALIQSQANIYRLYRAAFGRVPDLAGFKFWVTDNRPIWDMAAAMASSPEFTSMYNGMSREQIIYALYENILGREPDTAGYAYWVSRNDLTIPQMVAHFALSEENVLGTAVFTV